MIVNSVILRGKFRKEHPREIRYPFIGILKALRHLTQLALHLNLAGQNQERERHQASSFYRCIMIIQTPVQEICILIDDMVEANSLASLASALGRHQYGRDC